MAWWGDRFLSLRGLSPWPPCLSQAVAAVLIYMLSTLGRGAPGYTPEDHLGVRHLPLLCNSSFISSWWSILKISCLFMWKNKLPENRESPLFVFDYPVVWLIHNIYSKELMSFRKKCQYKSEHTNSPYRHCLWQLKTNTNRGVKTCLSAENREWCQPHAKLPETSPSIVCLVVYWRKSKRVNL